MWKFTQDRWVVRKEVAAVTKVSDFFFLPKSEVGDKCWALSVGW